MDDRKRLIEYIARSLVDDPDAVGVEVIDEGRSVVYELSVAPDDLGKVIGRDGRTARAMRALLAAAARRGDKRGVLEILE
ncbi:MAG: KH domain-containing protein [Myxococcales bacterium]|nr:KH domain-containing protein [Myxococcales bacterium]